MTGTYNLDQSDSAKLTTASCHIQKTAVFCDDPAIQIRDASRLQDLDAYKARLEEQMKLLEEVRNSIDAQIKSNSMKPTEVMDARLLIVNIEVYETELTQRTVNKDLEISDEKLYLLVLGYKCVGQFGAGADPVKVDETMPFPNAGGADLNKAFEARASRDLRGALKLDAKTRHISWSSADGTGGSARDLRHVIETDGEFSLQQASASVPNLGCYRLRGNWNSGHLSDRPVAKRAMKCMTNSVFADPQNPGQPKTTGWNVSFEVQQSGTEQVVELARPDIKLREAGFESVFAKLKYGVRLRSDKGLLKFEVYEQALD